MNIDAKYSTKYKLTEFNNISDRPFTWTKWDLPWHTAMVQCTLVNKCDAPHQQNEEKTIPSFNRYRKGI